MSELTDQMKHLLAAAEQASGAAGDMIAAIRDGKIAPYDNVGCGDTAAILADGLRLLIEATESDTGTAGDLHAALIKFLEEEWT